MPGGPGLTSVSSEALPFPIAEAGIDRRGISLLSIAHIVNDANQSAIPAMIPWLISHRGLNLATAATLVLAMNLSSSVVQPFFGHWSDRRSMPWIIPAALVLACTGTAAIGLVHSLPMMWLAALIAGIGTAAFHPESSRFANFFAGAKRATGVSIFTLGGYLGFAVGPILTTPLILHFGLEGTAFLAIPGVVLATILLFSQQHFHATRARANRAVNARPSMPDDWRAFGALVAVVVLRSTTFFAGVTFLPIFAISVAHASKTGGSIVLAAMLLVGSLGTMWGGRLADRFGRRRIIAISMVGTLVGAAALAWVGTFAPSITLVVLAASFFGLSVGLSAGVIVVLGQEYLPNRIGVASGVTLGLAVTIGGLAQPLFGAIGDRFGSVPIFESVAIFALLALAGTIFLPRKRLQPA